MSASDFLFFCFFLLTPADKKSILHACHGGVAQLGERRVRNA